MKEVYNISFRDVFGNRDKPSKKLSWTKVTMRTFEIEPKTMVEYTLSLLGIKTYRVRVVFNPYLKFRRGKVIHNLTSFEYKVYTKHYKKLPKLVNTKYNKLVDKIKKGVI